MEREPFSGLEREPFRRASNEMRLWLPAAIILAAVSVSALRAAQAPPRSAKEGVYTTEQADRGKPVYDGKCASCHGSMATVTPDMAPLLNDSGFQNLWRDRSLAQLFKSSVTSLQSQVVSRQSSVSVRQSTETGD